MADTSNPPTMVFAVVITYQPNLEALGMALERLVGQVDTVLIIDNGSDNAQAVAQLVEQHAFARFSGVPQNRGLGWAHNEGLRTALAHSADAVLLLDQDSLPRPGMVAALVHALDEQRRAGVRVAAVGARYLGTDRGHPSYFVRFDRLRFRRCFCRADQPGSTVPADMLISSGALFSRDALEALGLMDEGLFIDHLDTEWFLRAGAAGWRSFGVCDAVMDHGLGERTVRVWLGRWRYLPVHQPFRYYYVYRNSMLLWRRSYPSRRWKHTDMLRLAKMFVVFSLFTGQRLGNLGMMVRGIRDGLKGRTGPLEAHLPR